MKHLTRILTLSLTAAITTPSIAAASPPVLAPPGNSAISEYAEVVPFDSGATPPRSAAPLGSPVSRRLERLGSDGRLLAAVVADTAPATVGGGVGATAGARPGTERLSNTARSRAGGSDSTRKLPSGVGAASPASELLAAAGGGVGIALLALALGAAGVAIARAVSRRSAQ